jgi:hypothetical protein
MDEPVDGTVTGVVDSIDDDLARVLIGTAEEEWFFPVATLPDGVVEGDVVGFVESEGRYVADGFVGPRQTGNSIESRMARGINKRRTTEIRRSELKAAIDDAKGPS